MNTKPIFFILLLLSMSGLIACGDDERPPVDSGAGDTSTDGEMPDSTVPDAGDAGDLCLDVDCSAMDDMCNMGVCNPGTGACMQEPVTEGTACDDGDPCTTVSACNLGACMGIGAPDCTDLDDQCNVGMCDSMSGDCMAVPAMDGTMCDDSSACTSMDVCGGGVCAGVDECGGALYAENFEASDGGWTTGGTASSWEHGAPSNALISQAASGMNAWVTDLDGNYANNENSYIESPPLDFSAITDDPYLRFSLIFESEETYDDGWVEVSVDGGMTFTKLGTAASGINWYSDASADTWNGSSAGWHTAQHVLTGTAGEMDVRIRFVFDSDSTNIDEGFGVDDVLVIPDPDGDLALDGITVPGPECGRATGAIAVRVINLGTTDVTGFDVMHTVGSMAPVSETLTDTIAAGGTFDFTFSADVMVTMDEPVTARVTAAGDLIPVNDARATTIRTIPQVAGATYVEDFEADDGGFISGGPGNTWAHGTPSGLYIPAAASGAGAWVTNLVGDYNSDEDSNLDTICLDFTGAAADPILQFRHIYETEGCCDEGWVEISTDEGMTFTKLTGGASAINWYNDSAAETWNGDSDAGAGNWQLAQGVLTGAAGNVAIVRFRMMSDGSVRREGFGVDDLRVVADVAGDLAVERVAGFTAACGTSGGDVVVTLRNLGATDVTGFAIEYAVGTGAAVMETSTDTITAGGTFEYTFTTPASTTSATDVTVTVAAAGDPNAGNDSFLVAMPGPLPVTAFGTGYTEDFEADDGGWAVSGESASWAWGAPAATFISAAASGTNAWVTNLAGSYSSGELSYLTTSFCLDLTAVATDPTVSLSHIYETEACCDEGWLEMSTDSGVTWTTVGTSATGTNWYNDTDDLWNGDSDAAGTWRTASHELTGAAGNNVRLRFIMSADSSIQREGFGVDDIEIM